jgi:hypothetical protein
MVSLDLEASAIDTTGGTARGTAQWGKAGAGGVWCRGCGTGRTYLPARQAAEQERPTLHKNGGRGPPQQAVAAHGRCPTAAGRQLTERHTGRRGKARRPVTYAQNRASA